MRGRIILVTALAYGGLLGAGARAWATPSWAQAGFDAQVPAGASDPWAVISNTWVINNQANLTNAVQEDSDSVEAWMGDGPGYIFAGQEEWVDNTWGYQTNFYTCAMTTDGTIHCSEAINASQYYGDQIAQAFQRASLASGSSSWKNILWLSGNPIYTFGPWQIYGSTASQGSVYEKANSSDSGTACEPAVVTASWMNFRYNDTSGGNGFPSTSPDNSNGCHNSGYVQGDPSSGAQAWGWISVI